MREIKFRVWDVDEKEMLDDVCTNTDHFTDMLNETFRYWQNHAFEPRLVVMQYTGLKDKNGKEIYEGDILSNSAYQSGDAVEVVKFKNGAFYCESGADAHLFYNVGYYTEESQVLGNIYENPGLLTRPA